MRHADGGIGHRVRARVLRQVAGGRSPLDRTRLRRGIAPEDLAKARSLGLRGMRERIAFLGGSLEIARAPRGGTRLRVRVPLQGAAQDEAA